MQEKTQRAAASVQRQKPIEPIDASWGDLKIFLVCVDHHSFRKGAQILGMTDTTVMRRIDRLEEALGFALFVRHQAGLQLTDEGRAILDDARKMERLSFDIFRRAAHAGPDPQGVVRLAVTEGVGTYWVLPKLIDFQATYRRLTVDLRCAMEPADVGRLEADVAIQFAPPDNPDLIIAKLGRLHVYPFVSENYARDFGVPTSIAELRQHRIIQQVAPQLDETAYARALGVDSLAGIVGIRTNSSTATLYAVERGVGAGMLPTCSIALGARLVPLDVGIRHHLDLWLTYHPELKRSEKHMLLVNWLKRIFDPSLYACFKDEFIHPSELAARMGDAAKAMSLGDYAAPTPLR
ncbi:LysR family transcriptional regulator [Phreatobacter stygius]|uniref:LysR family transcriptional regulator n=1 Tax=Phreatobacter stygius TaxID=1940610 RepID=A0A4D7AY46_9HYPH|nr:LysR family transcriptional regulator [Phreatobacter stygius]QCI65151.1 LysR family transcriptional regulator [Phreatobacter stygius]